MEKVFRVETTLAQDLAELYAAVIEEFDEKSSIPLADMNRTLLQTGMLHHLTMMAGLGLVDPGKAARLDQLIERVARNTIMWDLIQMSRQYWQNCSQGQGGSEGEAV
jgi:hypothetical protein